MKCKKTAQTVELDEHDLRRIAAGVAAFSGRRPAHPAAAGGSAGGGAAPGGADTGKSANRPGAGPG